METWANVYACLTAVSGAVISGGLWSVLRLPRVCIPPSWLPAVPQRRTRGQQQCFITCHPVLLSFEVFLLAELKPELWPWCLPKSTLC